MEQLSFLRLHLGDLLPLWNPRCASSIRMPATRHPVLQSPRRMLVQALVLRAFPRGSKRTLGSYIPQFIADLHSPADIWNREFDVAE
jgi:hypothetical protein